MVKAVQGEGGTTAGTMLKSDDLSALLGCTRRHINQMISTGRLDVPFIRVGRRRYIRLDAWNAWVSEHQGVGDRRRAASGSLIGLDSKMKQGA